MNDFYPESSEWASKFSITSGHRPKGDISSELIADGLSRPRICTALRRWALCHEDVRRLVIYHTGARYSTAVLIHEASVCKIREYNQELISQLAELFTPPATVPETYIVGADFEDAPMFRRFGTIVVIDKDAQTAVRPNS